MPSKTNPRNHRNNPYTMDRLAVTVHHSAAGILWRFRTELAVLLTGGAAAWELARSASWMWALIILDWSGRSRLRAAVDPPVCRPPGLVRDLPAPAAAGVLRDPHAHPIRPPVPDLVDPADTGG